MSSYLLRDVYFTGADRADLLELLAHLVTDDSGLTVARNAEDPIASVTAVLGQLAGPR